MRFPYVEAGPRYQLARVRQPGLLQELWGSHREGSRSKREH
jgi:hypothetical protein